MSDNQFNAMKNVARYAFALVDCGLYLDAYPDDRDALGYYEEMKEAHAAAVAGYEKDHGPLTAESAAKSGDRWMWIDGPWPWQTKGGHPVCGRM